MRRTILGHAVTVVPCDGIPQHWRVTADTRFVGLVAMPRPSGWVTLPAREPGVPCGPVCHCPSLGAALVTLIVETIDH